MGDLSQRASGKWAAGLLNALLRFSALCVTCLVLGAPLARAGTYSARATAGPPSTGTECGYGYTSDGGSGFTSANVGPVPCGYVTPFGNSISSSSSASGSWVTGDFSATVGSQASAESGHGASIGATATDVFTVNGNVSLPAGMTFALATLGVTGVTGSAVGDGVAGYSSSGVMIELTMSAGGSSGSSGTSVACLNFNLYNSACAPDGYGRLGVSGLAPISLTVYDGETLQLGVTIDAGAFSNAVLSDQTANAQIIVDPVYLMLPAGVTFDSGITGFLSGTPAAVPEPKTWAMLVVGLAALCFMFPKSSRRTAAVA
jgi:hypothetical protein